MKPWNLKLETWWNKKIRDFPEGLTQAIWHMPDAASRRMQWLEGQLREVEKTRNHHRCVSHFTKKKCHKLQNQITELINKLNKAQTSLDR